MISILVILLLVIFVIAFFVLLWKSAKTWQWYDLLLASLLMILSLVFVFPTAGVARSRRAWNDKVESLEDRLYDEQQQNRQLKWDSTNGRTIYQLRGELNDQLRSRGRVYRGWQVTSNNVARGLTLQRFDNGAGGAAPPDAGGNNAAPETVKQGQLLYAFAVKDRTDLTSIPQSGFGAVSEPLPFFFMGEYEVTNATPNQLTLQPAIPLEPNQLQMIASGSIQNVMLTELLPIDTHDVFVAAGSQSNLMSSEISNVLGRVDEDLVNQLFFQNDGVTEPDTPLHREVNSDPELNEAFAALAKRYLDDGGTAEENDPPEGLWQLLELQENYQLQVDNLGGSNIHETDGFMFDSQGQAIYAALRTKQDDKGRVSLKEKDRLIVKTEKAEELLSADVATSLGYFYVRPLVDYNAILRETRLQIEYLNTQAEELERETLNLEKTTNNVSQMRAFRQDENFKLENDKNQYELERKAMQAYHDKTEAEAIAKRQRLRTLYLENVRLAEELRQQKLKMLQSLGTASR
ncbi:MAG: hypothetical protein AAFP90_04435 [Planctomycetota bacterium]